ncbi:MAG: hypothetical protein BAJALOKI2v1_720003 [Promethearchaeota archaeon]|nr:MAG: hypothetical protein BAJALOKI2v1_720003 [Candidatus Lokiarchaeota archaeon]
MLLLFKVKLKQVWQYKHKDAINGILVNKNIKTNNPELIVYTNNGEILILSLDGNLCFSEKVSEKQLWKGLIYEPDSQEKILNLLVGGMDGILRCYTIKSSYELVPIWTHTFKSSISGFFLEDLNNDGITELISYSLDKTLRVLNKKDGLMIWGQMFEKGIGDAIILPPFSDLEEKEVCACGNDGTLRIFDSKNGELKWFKKFSDKMRALTFLSVDSQKNYLLCGGDDRLLHIIDRNTKIEVKTLEFSDYLWKLCSYPHSSPRNVLVSTYSFEFLKDEKDLSSIDFSSGLFKYDSEFTRKWQVVGENIEILKLIDIDSKRSSIYGTTKGELKGIDETDGKQLFKMECSSCINDLFYLPSKDLIFSCQDDGSINSYRVN